MTITADVRKAGETVVSEAMKPFYAWVGIGELALTQVASLPARAQLLSPATIKAVVSTYGDQARASYDQLASRGEGAVARVRHRGAAEVTEPAPAPEPAPKAATKPATRPASTAAPRRTRATAK